MTSISSLLLTILCWAAASPTSTSWHPARADCSLLRGDKFKYIYSPPLSLHPLVLLQGQSVKLHAHCSAPRAPAADQVLDGRDEVVPE